MGDATIRRIGVVRGVGVTAGSHRTRSMEPGPQFARELGARFIVAMSGGEGEMFTPL